MPDQLHLDPARRHDFVFLFDVADGNPNGDPDAGNLPRMDPETLEGLVTDVCVKRKVRNFVDTAKGGEARFKIYVENRGILERAHREAYKAIGKESKGTKQDRATIDEARAWMCDNFYDVRTFGAVMSVGVNCGQVRGPVQLTFSRSVDRIVPSDLSITRVAVTKEEDAVKFTQTDDGEKASGKETEMGRKALIPYGLYRGYGFYSPTLADRDKNKDATGFDAADLALLWRALQMGFEHDRSASRGRQALRGLYVFTHDDPLGNAPAHTLQDRVTARLRDGLETETGRRVPRRFEDYEVTVREDEMPEGITLTRVVG